MNDFQIPQPIQNMVELQNFLALQQLTYTEKQAYRLQQEQVREMHAIQTDNEYTAKAAYLEESREERVRTTMKPQARPINRW